HLPHEGGDWPLSCARADKHTTPPSLLPGGFIVSAPDVEAPAHPAYVDPDEANMCAPTPPMTTQSLSFEHRAVSIEALLEGRGPLVVSLASLGRPAKDLAALSRRAAAAGFPAVRPQPRGIGRSAGPMLGVSLADLAGDVALVVERLAAGPAVLIGHAFGQ